MQFCIFIFYEIDSFRNFRISILLSKYDCAEIRPLRIIYGISPATKWSKRFFFLISVQYLPFGQLGTRCIIYQYLGTYWVAAGRWDTLSQWYYYCIFLLYTVRAQLYNNNNNIVIIEQKKIVSSECYSVSIFNRSSADRIIIILLGIIYIDWSVR